MLAQKGPQRPSERQAASCRNWSVNNFDEFPWPCVEFPPNAEQRLGLPGKPPQLAESGKREAAALTAL